MLTQERLKELLNYDETTGIFTWKERKPGRGLNGIAGYKNQRGYIVIKINYKTYCAHRLAYLYIHGYMPENEIDHDNQIKDDNRIDNLNEVSRTCNMRNTGNYKNNSSGVNGVNWNKAAKKWIAHIYIYIYINGNKKYLGRYKEFADAVMARYEKEKGLGWYGCESGSQARQWLIDNGYLK